jgi:hypothetical protein
LSVIVVIGDYLSSDLAITALHDPTREWASVVMPMTLGSLVHQEKRLLPIKTIAICYDASHG